MTDAIDLHPTRKGGLRPADPSRPRLDMTPFLTVAALPAHPNLDPAPALDYPMDHNDAWGDCVVAGWDHLSQVIHTLLSGSYVNMPDEAILEAYRTQNPNFDPNGSSSTNGPGSDADGGMNVQMFLEELRRRGVIVAFAQVDYTNQDILNTATYVFLGVLIAAQLQRAQVQEQFDQGVWTYVEGEPFIGGHCVPLVGYYECVSWAKRVLLAPTFVSKQVTEAWVVVTQAQLDDPGFRDSFDVTGFAAAYKALTHKDLPVPVSPPTPKPSPTPVPPAPAPTPAPAPPGGGASFLVGDPGVVARLEEVARKRGLDPNDWVTQHFQHYFRLYSLVALDLGEDV